MEGVPSDVVELIIAVDLNPSNPEEPLNVSSVDVRDKGEGGEKGGECRMCTKILDAVSKIDPEIASAVEGVSVDEAISALEKMASGAPEEAQKEADMFDKAMSRPSKPKPFGGGRFGGGSDRAFGKKRDEDEEDY